MTNTIANLTMTLNPQGEIDINLNIDYRNEANIELFKKVIKQFSDDIQLMDTKSIVKQLKAEQESELAKRVKELLQDIGDEVVLNKLVSSSLEIELENRLTREVMLNG